MTTPTPPDERADAERRKQVALFRYGVIADLIHIERGQRGLYAKLREKAARDWDIPGSQRRRVEAETIRGWLSDYLGPRCARTPRALRVHPRPYQRRRGSRPGRI
jgi:hypothetical protein